MHQVSRGVWWDDGMLERDLARRDDEDAARIGEWIAASGTHDVVQDVHLERLRTQLPGHFPAACASSVSPSAARAARPSACCGRS